MPSFITSENFRDGIIVRKGIDADYVIIEPKVITTSATLNDSDCVVLVNGTGPLTITLPSSPFFGSTISIKDMAGIAAASNITVVPATTTVFSPLNGSGVTVAGLIDGASSLVINVNYTSITLTFNGVGWSVM